MRRDINIIVLGNTRGKNETDEDVYERAYEKIDSFLEVEDNSIVDLFMQLMREFDMDFKIFKAMGMSLDDLEAEIKYDVKNRVDNVKDNIKSAEQLDNLEEELKSGVKNRVDNVKDNIKSAEQLDNLEEELK